MDDESSQFSKKTRIIIMIVAALAIAAIHIIYIRPRYGDSIPIILFQFFPLYFLWRILFGAKKEPPKKTPENEILLDATGRKNGRGAYLCPSMECLKKAVKGRGLERSFKMAISPEVYQVLEKEMEKLGEQE